MRYYAFGETRLATGTMFTDRLYTSQRFMPAIGLYHYGARFYSPTMGRFISADTIVSDLSNPQNLNRFSYVNNNPMNNIDPTGHFICSSDINSDDYCPNHGSTIGTTTGSYSGGGTSGGGSGGGSNPPEGYNGPIPQTVTDQLVAQGADPDFLSTVTIQTVRDEQWNKSCKSNYAAVTWYDTVYFCNLEPQYYDPNNPTPVLLHELIHVSQFQNHEVEVLEQIIWDGLFMGRDFIIDQWNESPAGQNIGTINIGKYDPYQYSWVEVQASSCQSAFKADSTIKLDRPPCNLAPYE